MPLDAGDEPLPGWLAKLVTKDYIVEHYSDWADEYDTVVREEYRYTAYSDVGKQALKWCLATEAETAAAEEAAEAVAAAAAVAATAGEAGAPEPPPSPAEAVVPSARRLRALDLGCGSGLSSLPLFDAGGSRISVVGVDLSPEMLEEAAKLPFATLLCQSIEEPLPDVLCPDGSFAVVLAVGVLEFVARPRALFAAVRRKLRPGGIFGFGLPCVDEERGEEVGQELGVRVYEPTAVRALVAAAGFEELEVKPIHGYTCGDATVQYRSMTFRRPLLDATDVDASGSLSGSSSSSSSSSSSTTAAAAESEGAKVEA